MLKTSSAVIAGLGVDPGRSAGYPNLFAGADHRHPVGRTRQRLAIRAVAYRYLLWIDVGLIGHPTAMALSFDIHRIFNSDHCNESRSAQKETAPEGAVLSVFHLA